MPEKCQSKMILATCLDILDIVMYTCLFVPSIFFFHHALRIRLFGRDNIMALNRVCQTEIETLEQYAMTE